MRGLSRLRRSTGLGVLVVAMIVLATSGCTGTPRLVSREQRTQQDDPSLAPFIVTPPDVVNEMLKLAEVRKQDLVYDLGSGDGRIVIAAARLYGARGVGFELDPDLVRRAPDNARRAGVDSLVEFHVQDVLTVDLASATVVTVYLSRDANLKLRPGLLSQLRPGSRVVSHTFDMGDWQPARILDYRDESGIPHILYLWRIPERR